MPSLVGNLGEWDKCRRTHRVIVITRRVVPPPRYSFPSQNALRMPKISIFDAISKPGSLEVY